MVSPSAGAVVLVTFPFSDLSQSKLRPAVVLAQASHTDWVLCQITSNAYSDRRAVEFTDRSFASGSLRLTSYARPAKLFKANNRLISAQVGTLTDDALQLIVQAAVDLLRQGW